MPGHIENYQTVTDAKNVGYTEIPYSSLGKITNNMRDGYFATNYTNMFVNVPWMIKKASIFIYQFVNDFQKQSMLFFDDDYKPTFKKVMGLGKM